MELKQRQTFATEKLTRRKSSVLFSDYIGQLHRIEGRIKSSMEICDVLFAETSRSNRLALLKQQTSKEQENYSQYVRVYKELDRKNQKPYSNTIRKIRDKIQQHQQNLSIMQKNPELYAHILEDKRQIWEDQVKDQPKWRTNLRGVSGLLGAFTLHLLVGAIYRWAMINNYVTSYYKITNDPSLVTNQNSISTPLLIFAVGLTMKPGMRLCLKYGKILVMGIAICGLIGTVYLSSFMPSFILFTIFHNFFYGLFAGFLFLTPMKQCQQYIPQYKLVINSFVLVGTGLGGEFFGVMNTRCFNPNGVFPADSGFYSGTKDYISYRVPECVRQMCWTIGIIGFIGLVLIWKLSAYNTRTQQFKTSHRISTQTDFQFICQTEEQALKSPIFWKIILLIILCMPGNFYTTQNYKNIPKETIHDPHFLEMVILAGGVANGLFRVVWGTMLRQIGFKYTFVIASVLNLICYACVRWAVHYYELYIIIYTIICAVLGGFMVLIPNLCLLVFGEIIGNQIFSYYWATFAFTSFFQYLLRYFFLDVLVSYVNFFNIFLIFSIVGGIFGAVITYQGRWQNSLKNLSF